MTTLAETIQERTAALRAPIGGDNPAGADVTFEIEFENLKKEIDKLSSVDGQKPNWAMIIDHGSKILKDRAKDMRVVTWVTVAMVQERQWDGFAEGLSVMRGLVTDFWDQMYPDAKRGRARANLVGWLIDQTTASLEKREVVAAEGDAIKLTQDLLKDIDAVLAAKLGDMFAGFGKLSGMVRDKVRAIPVEAPPPAATSAAAPTEASPAPQAAPPPAADAGDAIPSVTGMADLDGGLRPIRSGLIQISKALRKENPANALAYRMARTGAWLMVRDAPPNDGTKTKIPAPPPNIKKQLQTFVETEKWPELLNTAEDNCLKFIFWVEPQRLVSLALEKLGHAEAREVVGREFIHFTKQLPAFLKLAFADGTPFVEGAAAAWLEDEQAKFGAGSGGSSKQPSQAALAVNAEEEEVKKRFEDARKLVLDGNVPQGLLLGVQLAMRGADARTRFRSKLTVAQLALDGGKPEIARPMLESLIPEVDQHHLETWEPQLCIPLYTNLLACLRRARGGAKTPPAPEVLARETYLFDKLCRLDPASALTVGAG